MSTVSTYAQNIILQIHANIFPYNDWDWIHLVKPLSNSFVKIQCNFIPWILLPVQKAKISMHKKNNENRWSLDESRRPSAKVLLVYWTVRETEYWWKTWPAQAGTRRRTRPIIRNWTLACTAAHQHSRVTYQPWYCICMTIYYYNYYLLMRPQDALRYTVQWCIST